MFEISSSWVYTKMVITLSLLLVIVIMMAAAQGVIAVVEVDADDCRQARVLINYAARSRHDCSVDRPMTMSRYR